MKKHFTIPAFTALLLINGCASTNTQMVNERGQVANCGATGWGWIGAPMALAMSQDCINKYQAAGFHEVGTPSLASNATPASGSVSASATAPASPTTVIGKDGFFKITLPAGWIQTPPTNPTFQLAARNPTADTYLVISSVKATDIADWEAFGESMKAKLLANLAQSTSSETSKIRVNGFDALRADMGGVLKNGAKVHYLGTIIKSDMNIVYVLSWSLESKFASNRNEFEALPSAIQMF